MFNPVYDHHTKISQWAERNPHAQTVPHHIQVHIDAIKRYDEAQHVDIQNTVSTDEMQELIERLDSITSDYNKRRNLEHELAEYINGVAAFSNRPDLYGVSDRLNSCRMSGTVGLKPAGGHIIAWDSKCGLVRLCPDESREETKRIDKFYRPEILKWAQAKPTRRIFYAVFTEKNYPAGQLLQMKKDLFVKYKDFIQQVNGYKHCPVEYYFNHETKQTELVKTKPVNPKKIHSSLVIQEDPLSFDHEWHVHLNAILLVEGEFNYAEMRRLWGSNIEFKEVGQDEQSLSSAVRELIKYNTLIVSEKSEDKADQAQAEMFHKPAPGMLSWPADRFVEWWDAQQGFRRTRSYGALYALHGKKWNAMNEQQRLQVYKEADIPCGFTARDIVPFTWKEMLTGLPKKEREKIKVKLRKAMVHGESLDMFSVQWLGSMKWTGSSYYVDLIQGDNFSRKVAQTDNFLPVNDYFHDPGGGYVA